jgi:hypothetical protein
VNSFFFLIVDIEVITQREQDPAHRHAVALKLVGSLPRFGHFRLVCTAFLAQASRSRWMSGIRDPKAPFIFGYVILGI